MKFLTYKIKGNGKNNLLVSLCQWFFLHPGSNHPPFAWKWSSSASEAEYCCQSWCTLQLRRSILKRTQSGTCCPPYLLFQKHWKSHRDAKTSSGPKHLYRIMQTLTTNSKIYFKRKQIWNTKFSPFCKFLIILFLILSVTWLVSISTSMATTFGANLTIFCSPHPVGIVTRFSRLSKLFPSTLPEKWDLVEN